MFRRKRFAPTLLPAGHTYSMVTWKSSDESIATVTKEGVVRGVNGGTVQRERLSLLLLFL